jgi:FHA domain-containing protein/TIR domain-containing protein
MTLVFISYRRVDTKAIAGRICDRLVSHYSDADVFFDVDRIPFGVDFRTYIRDEIARSRVVLAIIGNAWRRNDVDNAAGADYVQIEIELGFSMGVPIIPVLIDDAVMPEAADLPESIRNLAYLNACAVDSGRDFHANLKSLIEQIDQLLLPEELSDRATRHQKTSDRFHTLELLSGPQPRQLYRLAGDCVLVGRHPDCDIVLKDESVSRRHAEITRRGSTVEIADCNSVNGIFINGSQVTNRVRLCDSDRIQIGVFVLAYHKGAGDTAGTK